MPSQPNNSTNASADTSSYNTIIEEADSTFTQEFVEGYYIGMMSGTSLDGMDAVLCQFDKGKARLVSTCSQPFDATLRTVLLALCQPNGCDTLTKDLHMSLNLSCQATSASELEWFGWASQQYAEFASVVVNDLLAHAAVSAVDVLAIGCHGQTVRHRPNLGFSLQLVDPNIIAERTGISVLTDFRRRDMAVGGQGAPLAPAFHLAQFASETTHHVVVNLGGIANITLLPAGQPDQTLGFDTGPASNLLDAWYQYHLAQSTIPERYTTEPLFDKSGKWAQSGTVHTELLQQLLTHPYFAKAAPKSTGREDFHIHWLQQQIDIINDTLSPQDVQATLTALTVRTLSEAILTETKKLGITSGQIIVCGGGAYNRYLMTQLADALVDWQLASSDNLGIAPTWVESMAFAWLARQTLLGQAGNLPAVTGARHDVVLGQVCFA